MDQTISRSSIEARCPICQRLLFRFSETRTYAQDAETTQTATPGGVSVEVKCSRCRSTITFSVPDGVVLGQSPGARQPHERRLFAVS